MSGILRRSLLSAPLFAYLWSKAPGALAQASTPPDVDWRNHGRDLASTRYAPLAQIDASNFNDLEVAWRFRSNGFGPQPEFNLQSTPLMVKGVLYTTIGLRRDVVGLDAATGEILWLHRLDEGERASRLGRKGAGRGVSYWSDGARARILFVTPGYQLVALDAATGRRIADFGQDGIVDLKLNNDQEIDLLGGEIGWNAPPCIAKDVVVIGALGSNGRAPKTHRGVKGYVRGFDVRTGKRLWIFHTIPQKGEFGYDTWLNDSAEQNGNTGVWCQISADEQLNLAYLGVEIPTGDYSGQYRPGAGLFGESLVAVDLHTGERRWHFQTVHHGLWDNDIPCSPILIDFPLKGRMVKAIAQPTKQAWLYVLDRATGKPIWPIVEKKVPKGDVPNEWYSPTQPFVTKPPPYDVQGVSEKDLIDFTPELRAEALELIKNYRIGPMFTPPSVYTEDGNWGTLSAPGSTGGANWPGGSWDPETHTLFVYSKTEPDVLGLIRNTDPEVSDFDYISTRGMALKAPPRGKVRANVLQVQGLPLMKPPYGRITAFDMTKGDIRWQVAHGETPDEVKNHPALKGLDIPRTGRAGLVGTLATKTLVIAGEPGFFTAPNGQRGAMLRAYDKATGEEKGAVFMPAPASSAPMTYMLGGVQYIVVAIGAGAYPSEFVAFRLPKA